MKKNSVHRVLLTLAFAGCFPAMASAGIFDDDEARKAILDLRAKIEALNARLDSRIETKADKSTALDLANENEKLRAELAKLRGQVEVLANDIANAQRRQQDFYVDLDNRIRKLEPKRMVVDGREAVIEPGEERAFEGAMNVYKSGDFKAAVNGFSGFLNSYPNSVYAGQAQYWMGNSYLAQRDCKGMIPVMQQLVKSYPDHPKAPEALLNISLCQVELKDKPAAKKTLETIVRDYPNTEAAQAAKSRIGALK
ncbi:tol-pal system protein YbgF [Undibacterium squillarum]|uniref:Cell division coordinator CpoB n=1 Tax=Undibacterium squillarum TaxID=1131567 RepID=A0ABQ2XTT5_9BURK|nr:tol-pal system protein YbgF [Undibacterium squillarum]GGX32563.1 tol-pal system protein YbgF [Undibacterium squillarum]